jgi:hypothetical protein
MQVLQTLTLAKVKTKAREYYEAGKLTAQHPDPNERMCVNKGKDGHRCAVATAFNDALLEEFPGGTIHSVKGSGAVAISGEDFDAIAEIQNEHDRWASHASYEGREDYYAIETFKKASGHEQKFLALISDEAA